MSEKKFVLSWHHVTQTKPVISDDLQHAGFPIVGGMGGGASYEFFQKPSYQHHGALVPLKNEAPPPI